MQIGIMGAGKVGCALAIGLKGKGVRISGVYSRSNDSAVYLNNRLGLAVPNDIVWLVKNSDTIFLAVPDKEINILANTIAKTVESSALKSKVFFHCSGALTSDELSVLAELGGVVGSLHPLQTFADKENGWRGMESIYFGFEGCKEALLCAKEIMGLLNGSMLMLDKESKPLYHAAACILSNYMVTLSYISDNILASIGIQSGEGTKAFMPLIEKTVENIKSLGALKALTGPVSRGDCGVIRQHIEALNGRNPEMVEVYKSLGRKTVEAALKKGSIDGNVADNLNECFKG